MQFITNAMLFNLYIERGIEECKEALKGIKIKRVAIKTIRFADITILEDRENKLQNIQAVMNKGLQEKCSMKKPEIMVWELMTMGS